MEEIAAVDEELLDPAAVETQRLANLCDRLRVGHRAGEIDRRVPGQRPGEHEGDDDDAEDGRQRLQQPPSDLYELGPHDARRPMPW